MSKKIEIIDDPDELDHLPTYKEIKSHITNYIINDEKSIKDTYEEVAEGIKSFDCAQTMVPADGASYFDDRITILLKLNALVIETIENLEFQESELLNSYQDDTTYMNFT